MIDAFFFMMEVIYSASLLINLLLLFVYFHLPLKINTSKYFIPLTVFQNIVYAVCSMLSVPTARKWRRNVDERSIRPVEDMYLRFQPTNPPKTKLWLLNLKCRFSILPKIVDVTWIFGLHKRAYAWNFCWVMTTSSQLTSKAWSTAILTTLFLIFITSVMTITNSFLHKYLQICRYKYFHVYSTSRGFFILFATNGFVITTWVVYIYFGLWPTAQLIEYLRLPMLSAIGVDLDLNGVFGICLKPTLNWGALLLTIESMTVMSLLASAGMYWAVRINQKLKESSLSSQTKTMQRRMNNLLIVQTACPALFLQLPALAQYVMMYTGTTSGNILLYASMALWTLFPVSSPIVTLVFLTEYRNFLLNKIGFGLAYRRVRASSFTGQRVTFISTLDYDRRIQRNS